MSKKDDDHRAPVPVPDAYLAHRYIIPSQHRPRKKLWFSIGAVTTSLLLIAGVASIYTYSRYKSTVDTYVQNISTASTKAMGESDYSSFAVSPDADHDGFPDNLFGPISDEGELTNYENVSSYTNHCQADHSPQEFMNAWIALFKQKNHLTDAQFKQSVAMVDATLAGSFHTGDTCVLMIDYDAKVDCSISRKGDAIQLDSPSMTPNELGQRLATRANTLIGPSTQNTLSEIDFAKKLAFTDKRDALKYFATQKNVSVKTMIDAGIGISPDSSTPSVSIRGTVQRSKERCYEASMSLATKDIISYQEHDCPKPGFDVIN